MAATETLISAGTRLGEVEDVLDFLHLGGGHAIGLGAHAAGAHVDVGGLAENVGLIEGIHDVLAYGYGAVFFPHDYVVGLDLLEGGLGEGYGRGECVGHDADAERSEGEGLGNHRPEYLGHLVTLEETLDVAHGNELDRMGVEGSLVAAAGLEEVVLKSEVGGQFAGRNDVDVGDDFVGGAVIEDADDAAVLHGFLGEVAHALAGAFAIEVLAFQIRKGHADGLHFGDGRHGLALVVHKLSNVDGDVAAIALSPAFLPKVAGDFGDLVDDGLEGGAVF